MKTGVPISTEQQNQIKAMAAAGKTRPEIAKAVGVSGWSVTKYAPTVRLARQRRKPTTPMVTKVTGGATLDTIRMGRVPQNGNHEGVRTITATVVPTGHKTYLVVLPGWGVLVGRRATLKV